MQLGGTKGAEWRQRARKTAKPTPCADAARIRCGAQTAQSACRAPNRLNFKAEDGNAQHAAQVRLAGRGRIRILRKQHAAAALSASATRRQDDANVGTTRSAMPDARERAAARPRERHSSRAAWAALRKSLQSAAARGRSEKVASDAHRHCLPDSAAFFSFCSFACHTPQRIGAGNGPRRADGSIEPQPAGRPATAGRQSVWLPQRRLASPRGLASFRSTSCTNHELGSANGKLRSRAGRRARRRRCRPRCSRRGAAPRIPMGRSEGHAEEARHQLLRDCRECVVLVGGERHAAVPSTLTPGVLPRPGPAAALRQQLPLCNIARRRCRA